MSKKIAIGLLIAALGAGMVLGGCGGGLSDASGPGILRGTTSAFPDYLDPALSQTLEGQSAMWNTYLPLLTYPHAEGRAGTRLVPCLARALPRISDGGRTYTLFLRRGLHYSDGTLIRASDFSHSVKRLLALNSAGSVLFTGVVGAERFARTKRGGISGINTDDRNGRITIKLREPRSTFAYALASLYAAPLPADTPIEDLTSNPAPASGPYEITSSLPGRGWEYRRNPAWRARNERLLPTLPSGRYARIEITVLRNLETEVDEVERGRYDWMINPPPSDRLAELRGSAGARLLSPPQINVFYFWMNTTMAPFDDPRVRRAVNYAIRPAALDRIYGGELRPLQQILPAAMPGHRTFRLYPFNFAKAKRLMRRANPAERSVGVWTNDYPPNLQAAEYFQQVLEELGLQTTLKKIGAANYFAVVGNNSTPELNAGFGNWLLEYPHPNSFFEPQLTGEAAQPSNNTNLSRFDDPALDARVRRLRREPFGPATEAAYARLDRAYMRQAPWAPFGTLALPTFISTAINPEALIISPIYGQDLTSFAPR